MEGCWPFGGAFKGQGGVAACDERDGSAFAANTCFRVLAGCAGLMAYLGAAHQVQ